MGQRTTEYDIVGTVAGNVFRYRSTRHPLEVEMVIDGDTMYGTGERPDTGAVGEFFVRRKQ
jgi:hypothetical protein